MYEYDPVLVPSESISCEESVELLDPCMCCCESLLSGIPTYIPDTRCKCRCCVACWIDWLDTSINQRMTDIPCICAERTLDQHEVEGLLNEQLYRKLVRNQNRKLFETHPNTYLMCLTPDCGNVFVIDEEVWVECELCLNSFCRNCKVQPYHLEETGDPMTCEDFQKGKKTKGTGGG